MCEARQIARGARSGICFASAASSLDQPLISGEPLSERGAGLAGVALVEQVQQELPLQCQESERAVTRLVHRREGIGWRLPGEAALILLPCFAQQFIHYRQPLAYKVEIVHQKLFAAHSGLLE